MGWIDETLERLSHSDFRSKFTLSAKDRAYARVKGRDVINRHAHEMLRARVGAAEPEHDGRQTPWRGHPVFTAQHATATCCRGCIAKWHHIPKGRALTDDEVNRLASLVMTWIDRDLAAHCDELNSQPHQSTRSTRPTRTNQSNRPNQPTQPVLF